MNLSACWKRREGELRPLLPRRLPWGQRPPTHGHRRLRLRPRTPGTASCRGARALGAAAGSGARAAPLLAAAGRPRPCRGARRPRRAGPPRDGYLLRAADEAQEGCVVPARPEGSVVVALPVGPIAQHEVHGGAEVEHGGHVGAGQLAGVEGLRVPRAGAFHRRAVARRDHDELVLPAGQGGERAGGDGPGPARAGRRRLRWGNPPRGRPQAALTWPPQGHGRRGGGQARPSLGTGRCPARRGSWCREGAGRLAGKTRGRSVRGSPAGAVRGAGAAAGSAGCGAQLLRAQAPRRRPGARRAGAGELPQPGRTPRPGRPRRRDRGTASLTRAVGLKLPQRRSPGSGCRESPHRHHVAAAGAVLRQRVLSDGAAQPQPLHLQKAAVLRAPGRHVQLGTGDGAGGRQLPPALREPARGTPRRSEAPLRANPSLRPLPLGKAPGGQPWPRAWTSRQARGGEGESGAKAQGVGAAAPVSRGPSLCEELRARGSLALWRGVYARKEAEARPPLRYCNTAGTVVTPPTRGALSCSPLPRKAGL